MHATLPAAQHLLVEEIVCAFRLEGAAGEDDNGGNGFLRLVHDIPFYAPAAIIAGAWAGGPSYLYHFSEPNPWPGRWARHAAHLMDIAFLWQNYDEALAPAPRQVSQRFSGGLIAFIHGRATADYLYKRDFWFFTMVASHRGALQDNHIRLVSKRVRAKARKWKGDWWN
jgi:carboxylesterase type B